MTVNDDLVNKFIKRAKTETKFTPPITSRRQRVLVGIAISIVVASIYSIIAETINILPNSKLPLYFHPFGTVGNILYVVIIAGLAGVAGAWSEKAISSVIAGGLTLVIGIEVKQFLSASFFFASLLPTILSFFALLSIAFEMVVLTLIMGLIRMAVDIQLEKPHLKFWHWQKTWVILVLLGISITAGYLSKMPDEWAFSLKMANNLIQDGLKAKTESELPKGLTKERVGDFLTYSSKNYKLEVNNTIQYLFFEAYPDIHIPFESNVVIVYFESGQDLACLSGTGQFPICLPITRKIKFPPIIF